MGLVLIKQPCVLPRQRDYQYAKRVMDILICLVILPVALLVSLFCAIAIYLNSPGQVLFIQERIGKGGRPFRIYKLRTMKLHLDEGSNQSFIKAYVRGDMLCQENSQEVYKPIHPGQTFRVGALLRKTSLDELPQIINVLKGEMSLVGPRPNVRREVDAYYPWHHERLEVLPGITGLAQVHGRSCIDFNTLVRYDVQYIENRCLVLDFKILWWTVIAIVNGKGAL
jgi:lipopolysaccharide/colanic/teichoic acid biosynthesis glycosyltransferase